MDENKNDRVIGIVLILYFIVMILFIFFAINPEKHESDPAVYERYVEDMRNAGRKPNGEPIEPDVFEDSTWRKGAK